MKKILFINVIGAIFIFIAGYCVRIEPVTSASVTGFLFFIISGISCFYSSGED